MLVKNGKTTKGVQKYIDLKTGETKLAEYQVFSNEAKISAVMAYLKGLSLRSAGEIVGASHVSVFKWFKVLANEFRTSNLVDPNKQFDDVEIDEIWHFCKKNSKSLGFRCP